jgi:hypothetical protein
MSNYSSCILAASARLCQSLKASCVCDLVTSLTDENSDPLIESSKGVSHGS